MVGLPGEIGQFAQRHVAQVTKFDQEHVPTPLLSTAGGLARDCCRKADPVRKQSTVLVSEKKFIIIIIIIINIVIIVVVGTTYGSLLKLKVITIGNKKKQQEC